MHELHHELEDHRTRHQSGDRRDRQRRQRNQMRVSRQQISRPAKPRKERHCRRSVEPGDVHAAAQASASTAVVPHVKWQMHLEWKMNVDRARKKRHHAERESHHEAEEIKIRPGHTAPRAHPVRELDSGRRPLTLIRGRMLFAPLPACFGVGLRPQYLAQAIRQTRRTKNLAQQ